MLESILKRKREAKGNGNLALEDGGVAQLGEHLPCTQGVRSSILLISTSSEPLRALPPIESILKEVSKRNGGLKKIQGWKFAKLLKKSAKTKTANEQIMIEHT